MFKFLRNFTPVIKKNLRIFIWLKFKNITFLFLSCKNNSRAYFLILLFGLKLNSFLKILKNLIY